MKHTAKNNEFLEAVKKLMNEKIYKVALKIFNDQGQEETIKYLNQFCNWKELEKYYVPFHLQFYKDK